MCRYDPVFEIQFIAAQNTRQLIAPHQLRFLPIADRNQDHPLAVPQYGHGIEKGPCRASAAIPRDDGRSAITAFRVVTFWNQNSRAATDIGNAIRIQHQLVRAEQVLILPNNRQIIKPGISGNRLIRFILHV